MNINTRRLCSSCRLAKCFASGMQIKLIRCSHTKRKTKKQTAKKVIESIIPMNNNSVRRDQVQRVRLFIYYFIRNIKALVEIENSFSLKNKTVVLFFYSFI